MEPLAPALVGRFLTSGPPGKSLFLFFIERKQRPERLNKLPETKQQVNESPKDSNPDGLSPESVLSTLVQYCPEDLTPILVNFHDKSRASLRAVSTEKRISFFRCQVEQACSEGTRGPQF